MSFISLLHQTTTIFQVNLAIFLLSFISLLHQTTTPRRCPWLVSNCLLSLFYIKPQQQLIQSVPVVIVFYLSSTSNHNFVNVMPVDGPIVFYLSSTSNHNWPSVLDSVLSLSFISLLHQTTTYDDFHFEPFELSFISLLHQTTTCTSYFIYLQIFASD